MIRPLNDTALNLRPFTSRPRERTIISPPKRRNGMIPAPPRSPGPDDEEDPDEGLIRIQITNCDSGQSTLIEVAGRIISQPDGTAPGEPITILSGCSPESPTGSS